MLPQELFEEDPPVFPLGCCLAKISDFVVAMCCQDCDTYHELQAWLQTTCHAFDQVSIWCVGAAGAAFPEPQQAQPVQEVPGLPPLVRCASLLDRRRILAQDSAGDVELWDVSTGSVVKRFGQVPAGPD